MKIFISEIDRQNAHRIALKNISSFFKIPDIDNKTNEVLLKDISRLKNKTASEIIELIKGYFKAYDEWFEFYQQKKKIEKKAGKEYDLNKNDLVELKRLIENKENRKNTLQQKFDEMQLALFNKKMGVKNLKGTIHHA